MKTVKILLCFAFITIIVGNVNSQNKNQMKMDSLIESFKHLTDKKNEYNIEFVENKNTLIFNFKTQDSEEIRYKAILTDIHPQGIFRFESDNKTFIRILSIDNGHRFIKDGFKVSHTTNIIDIELAKNIDLKKVERVIKDLKSVLKKPVIESDEIIIVGPESKNEK